MKIRGLELDSVCIDACPRDHTLIYDPVIEMPSVYIHLAAGMQHTYNVHAVACMMPEALSWMTKISLARCHGQAVTGLGLLLGSIHVCAVKYVYRKQKCSARVVYILEHVPRVDLHPVYQGWM